MFSIPTILTITTVVVSLMAFNNMEILGRLILSPYSVVHKKEWYRVITHAFIHADWGHLIFNMIALWSFGEAIEYYFSAITEKAAFHFLLMYFGAIIFSSIPDLIKQRNNPNYLSLGASGGVSAVVFAAILFNPWHLIYVFFIPCPGIIFAILYVVYSTYQNQNKQRQDNINHGAHLYGSIFGLIYPILLEPGMIKHFWSQLISPSF